MPTSGTTLPAADTAIPDGTATADPTTTGAQRIPPSAEEAATRDELVAALSQVRGVDAVIEAIEVGDPVALTALFEPLLRYCEWVPEEYRRPATPVPEEIAHLASCADGAATYEVWRVTAPTATTLPGEQTYWSEGGTESLLTQLLAADVELRASAVSQYRRVRLDGSLTIGERYVLTFAIGPNELHHRPGWSGSEPQTFVLRIEAGEARPIDSLEFIPGAAPRPEVLAPPKPLPNTPLEQSDPAVLAAVADFPEVTAVIEAMTGGDVEAALALLSWQESNCISPPLPGKESPEVCDALEVAPGSSYRWSMLDLGLLFPASEQRLRWWLSALAADDTPIVSAAWRIEGAWGEGSDVRIAVGFVSEPTGLIERDSQLRYWEESLDGVWFFIDPGSGVSHLQFFGLETPQEPRSPYVARDSSFRATRLPEN